MQALIQSQNDVLNVVNWGSGWAARHSCDFACMVPFHKLFCARSVHNMCAVNPSPHDFSIPHQAGFGEGSSGTPYAVQLFTKSAELGYFKACYCLCDVYEHGELNCSRYSTLSIPPYTSAAHSKHPRAIITVCLVHSRG